jgi:hypothetical protein
MEISIKYIMSYLNHFVDYIIMIATWFYISPPKDLNAEALRLSHQKDILVFAFLAVYFLIRILIAIKKHEKITIENDLLKEELRKKRLQNDLEEKVL